MLKQLLKTRVYWGPAFLAVLFLFPAAALAGQDKEKAEPAPVKLAKITISGGLQDALPPVNPFGSTPMYFKKLIDLIHEAAEDKNIKGVMLEVNSPQIGMAKVKELNRALKSLKSSGKMIFGYAESLDMKDLLLMSACDYLAIPESGLVALPGLNIEVMYYKHFFEKLGITFMVEHIGDYKSAYENYNRESMSEPFREVLEVLLDAQYYAIVSMVARNRGIEEINVIEAIDHALVTPKKALAYGLVDEVCYRDQFDDKVKELLKAKKVKVEEKYGRDDKDLNTDNPLVLFSQIMSSLSGAKKKESKDPKIALIYASGVINSGKNQMDPFSGSVTIGSDTLSEAIKDAGEDETVKAIVLRVDSPGGSGLASDMIWRAEIQAKAKKPFIVSMADVAASGGYYISAAADVILAEPNTITGSIGVVSAIPNISKTMDKIGIKIERLSRGRNANLMSMFSSPEEVNLSILSGYMEEFYWDFLDKVASGRNMTRDDVHKIAQGRVWTGKQALENGLVDALGGLEDAIQIAKLKAGLDDTMKWELKEMPKSPDFFESLSESMGVKMFLSKVMQTAGLNPLDAVLLENPQLKARLGRLASVLRISQTEPIMCLMPVDIQTDL